VNVSFAEALAEAKVNADGGCWGTLQYQLNARAGVTSDLHLFITASRTGYFGALGNLFHPMNHIEFPFWN
jgi:hypothetical protein